MKENPVQARKAIACEGIARLRRKEVSRAPGHRKLDSLKSIVPDLIVEVQTWIEYDCKRAVAKPTRKTVLTTVSVALFAVAMATCRPVSCTAKQTNAPVKICTEAVAQVSPEVSLGPFTRPIVATSGAQ